MDALIPVNTQQTYDNTLNTAIDPRGAALNLRFTSRTPAPLRAQMRVVTNGTEMQTYCYEIPAGSASPISIPYGNFNTQCWAGGMGTRYVEGPISAIQLMVPGGNAAAIPFDFCLTGVQDG